MNMHMDTSKDACCRAPDVSVGVLLPNTRLNEPGIAQ